MKRLSWKYIAGLIDGEGCLDVQTTKINDKFYIRPRIRITLADNALYVLEILKTNHGGFISHRPSTNANWQSSSSWELVGYSNVEPFLRNFFNHLIIKKEQARLLLWMEQNLKGKQVSSKTKQCVRDNLSAMKRDPHRLSEKAQEDLLGCDSRPSTMLGGNVE